jgi:hypothetical protein
MAHLLTGDDKFRDLTHDDVTDRISSPEAKRRAITVSPGRRGGALAFTRAAF